MNSFIEVLRDEWRNGFLSQFLLTGMVITLAVLGLIPTIYIIQNPLVGVVLAVMAMVFMLVWIVLGRFLGSSED